MELGHRFHLYVYDAVDVPPGVVLKNGNDVIPREELFHFRNPFTGREDVGPFSDLFRFRLLSARGGWWSDVDTVCLSPDIPEVKDAWASELPEINERRIGTSQLALTPGTDLSNLLYSECLGLSRKPLEVRESLGPHLLTRLAAELKLPPCNFGTASTFYPIRWIEAFKLWLPQFYDEVSRRTVDALFLPLYQSLPHYLGMDVTKLPPAGSYLALLCNRFEVSDDGAERHDVEDVLQRVKRFFVDNHDWAIPELAAVGGEQTLHALGLA